MTLNKSTLSEQIYQILRSDILTSRIPMGEKLTLKMLQERFEVSSTPIREALTRLAEDELVVCYSNVGVNVIQLSEKDLQELYRFMGDMDALAILYAAEHHDQQKLLAELSQNISFTDSILQKAALTPEETASWITCSDNFHLIFYNYCNNSRLIHASEKLRSQLTIFSNRYETSPEIQKSIDSCHREIYHAYKKKDPEEAARLMREHLAKSLEYAIAAF